MSETGHMTEWFVSEIAAIRTDEKERDLYGTNTNKPKNILRNDESNLLTPKEQSYLIVPDEIPYTDSPEQTESPFPPTELQHSNPEISSNGSAPRIYTPTKIKTNTRPLLVGEHHRKFDNPISYLGGPKLPARNRWSVESVVSID